MSNGSGAIKSSASAGPPITGRAPGGSLNVIGRAELLIDFQLLQIAILQCKVKVLATVYTHYTVL